MCAEYMYLIHYFSRDPIAFNRAMEIRDLTTILLFNKSIRQLTHAFLVHFMTSFKCSFAHLFKLLKLS